MNLQILSLIGILTTALAAPAPVVSTPGGTQVQASFPVGNGGAVVSDSNSNRVIFYQTGDGAIQALSGAGNSNGINYVYTRIIEPGVAQVGTPLAAVSPDNDLSSIRLYFIDPNNYLQEYLYYASKGPAWTPGGLGAAGFGNKPGSKYLWAAIDDSKYSRVGFVKTDNTLSEAYDNTNGGWDFTPF